MNNQEYNLRIQNIFHSDRLNSLLDCEYFLPIYYNSLYTKIDQLLANINDSNFEFQGDEESEDAESFTEDDNFSLSDVDNTTRDGSKDKLNFKNMQNMLLKSMNSFRMGNTVDSRIHAFRRSGNTGSLTIGGRNKYNK